MFVVGGEREGFEGFACYEDRLNWFGVLLYACTVCAICAFPTCDVRPVAFDELDDFRVSCTQLDPASSKRPTQSFPAILMLTSSACNLV